MNALVGNSERPCTTRTTPGQRALTSREQRLISGWKASREKDETATNNRERRESYFGRLKPFNEEERIEPASATRGYLYWTPLQSAVLPEFAIHSLTALIDHCRYSTTLYEGRDRDSKGLIVVVAERKRGDIECAATKER
ncbi:hypothetical protein MTO96_027784 [Rhipicephalus appendiculatus]